MSRPEMSSVSEAKIHLHDLVARARAQPTVLLRHSKPEAVIISYDQWVSMQDEIEDLKDRLAVLRARLEPSSKRIPHSQLLRELGLVAEEAETYGEP